MMRSSGGESGVVIEASPAFTPSLPVSQTSPSFSTFLRPEIVIAFQGVSDVSTHGMASAKAVKHDNSWPRIAAASATRQRVRSNHSSGDHALVPAISNVSLKALASAGTESTMSWKK